MGNPGKRPLNEKEPIFPGADPEGKTWLRKAAEHEHERLAPILRAQGLLTEADRRPFEAYCKAYARWRQAEEILDKWPTLVTRTKTGYLAQAPWVAISQKYLQLMISIASEFGFTPAARSRISKGEPPGAKKPQDGDFFGDQSNGKGQESAHLPS